MCVGFTATTFASFGAGEPCHPSACAGSIDQQGNPYSTAQMCDPYGQCDAALGRSAAWPIVTQGTVTAYEGDDPNCTPHVYSATGTNAFVDIGSGDVHMIRDESGAIAKTVAVQLIPKGATRRIDVVPAPGNCPF